MPEIPILITPNGELYTHGWARGERTNAVSKIREREAHETLESHGLSGKVDRYLSINRFVPSERQRMLLETVRGEGDFVMVKLYNMPNIVESYHGSTIIDSNLRKELANFFHQEHFKNLPIDLIVAQPLYSLIIEGILAHLGYAAVILGNCGIEDSL